MEEVERGQGQDGGKRLRSPVHKLSRGSEPILPLWGWTSGDMMHDT